MQTLPQKRTRPDPYICTICFKLLGSTVLCGSCHNVSVHRKCGNITGSTWTCTDCLSIKKEENTETDQKTDNLEVKKEEKTEEVKPDIKESPCESDKSDPEVLNFESPTPEPISVRSPSPSPASDAPPTPSPVKPPVQVVPPSCPFSISRDRLQPETVFKRVMTFAASDESLLHLLASKQTDYHVLYEEFEERKLELGKASLGDQEFRMALFRLQEKLLTSTARVRKELIDQLRSARVFGFEGIKHLKEHRGVPDPPFKELEEYKKVQNKVADRMLAMAIPDVKVTNSQKEYELIPKKRHTKKPKNTVKPPLISEILLNPLSKMSVFVLLSNAIRDVKQRKSESDGGEFTERMLSAVVKGAVDGCISALEGFRGGSTDPGRMEDLLVKIREKY